MKPLNIFIGSLLLLLGSNAYAIVITPNSCNFNGGPYQCWSTTDNSNFDGSQVSAITGVNVSNLAYKSDSGDPTGAGSDSGSFAGSYDTLFDNTAIDPQDALISYITGAAIDCLTTGNSCILVVKDGNATPAQYFINLTGIWNGTDSLDLQGFWPNQGAISNVAIWTGTGGSTPPGNVPEPSITLLLGIGLLGFLFLNGKEKAV